MEHEELSNSTIFPLGEKVEANFIGDAYLQMVLPMRSHSMHQSGM